MVPSQPQVSPSSSGDRDLAMRMAAGDERALSVLYDRVGTLAYSVAMAMLHDAAEAEEAVGDAFAQVWRQAGRFDAARGSLQGWVTTVVRSRALDRLRARRRSERVVVDESAIPEGLGGAAADVAATPDVAAESDEQRRQVETALAALSPAQQESLRLAYFEGLSQSEIAERLDEPLGTVKTRMRAALIKLRTMLAPMRERGEL